MTIDISGLYAITPENLVLDNVCQALMGGARIIQYRKKNATKETRLAQALELKKLCAQFSVPLIINDDVALAIETGADGAHLGIKDGSIRRARKMLAGKLLGVSCYNDPELAKIAEKEGADYVAFGSFFPSTTKPDAVKASLEILGQANLPVVAIGGITVENGMQLVENGADCLAVVSALFEARDVRSVARQFSNFFPSKER